MANTKSFWTKYPHKKSIPSPKRLPKENEKIARNVAVSLIADRCDQQGTRSEVRNKVNRNLRHAVRQGRLTEHDDSFIFGELVAWTKTCKPYADCMDGIAHTQRIAHGGFAAHLFGTPHLVVLPARLEDCHAALIEAQQIIAKLVQELQDARQTLKDQRPMVEMAQRMKAPRPRKKTGD